MCEKLSCEEFQELLDAAPDAAGAGRSPLERHAAGCRDCALLLRVHDHLAAESLDDLEARVPDGLVDEMWSRVSERTGDLPAVPGSSSAPRWLLPALAASIAVLLFASGLLLSELRQARGRERRLLAALDHGTAGAQIADASPSGRDEGFGRLAAKLRSSFLNQGEYTAAGIRTLLEGVPSATVIIDANQVRALTGRYLHLRLFAGRGERNGLRLRDGLTAGELLRFLTTSGLDPDATISRSRLSQLLAISAATRSTGLSRRNAGGQGESP